MIRRKLACSTYVRKVSLTITERFLTSARVVAAGAYKSSRRRSTQKQSAKRAYAKGGRGGGGGGANAETNITVGHRPKS